MTRDRKSSPLRVPSQNEHLLIVERKAGQARKLQQELASSGYFVTAALGPQEALSSLGQQKVSLILVDGNSASPSETQPRGPTLPMQSGKAMLMKPVERCGPIPN